MNIAELRNRLAYLEKSLRNAYIVQSNTVEQFSAESWLYYYHLGKKEIYDECAGRTGALLDWLDREMNKDATDKE